VGFHHRRTLLAEEEDSRNNNTKLFTNSRDNIRAN
jgi:hypothetical protein